MKEYKNRSLIQIHNADCLEALKSMQDNEFELAIVDPPYGAMKRGIDNIPRNSRNNNNKDLYDLETAYTNVRPTDEYFQQLRRVSKN